MRVLVVDHDTTVGQYICLLIEAWGHRVERSQTGRATLARSREESFDLVLLDTALSDIMTTDLIQQLKVLQPEAGIIMMTGSHSGELERELRKLGIIYYMPRPFQLDELKSVLDHVSRRRDVGS